MFHVAWEITVLDLPLLATLILLEFVLSFDNAAVLAAMVYPLPREQRRRALLYGLVGAYVMRILAILGVSYIIQNAWLKFVGGGYLIYLAATHLLRRASRGVGEEGSHIPVFLRWMGLRGFWGVVVAVEIADLAFAIDQVVAAVAMTSKVPVIVGAAIVAIFFLRIAASYMARLMDWFPALESFAYAAVGFVGAKLVVVEIAVLTGGGDHALVHALEEWSFVVTLLLLGAPLVLKFLSDRTRRRPTPGEPPNL